MEHQTQISLDRTIYRVKKKYISTKTQAEQTIKLVAEQHAGRVSFSQPYGSEEFVFKDSDPDRVIALAQAMIDFAAQVKNQNYIDSANKSC